MRALTEAGFGVWFGAFAEGQLAGDLGLFVKDRIGRFQEVETYPAFRRRGVCRSLVYQASHYAFEHMDAQKLVLVADEGSDAARLYQQVGFQPTERQAGIDDLPLKRGLMGEITIKAISIADAKEKLAQNTAVFIDVRDPDSYQEAHIPGAVQLNDSNVGTFLAAADKTQTHIVYCYHGITSQSGAAYFQENGFEDVYSMDGGFCAWED